MDLALQLMYLLHKYSSSRLNTIRPENWERHIDAKAVMMARVISN